MGRKWLGQKSEQLARLLRGSAGGARTSMSAYMCTYTHMDAWTRAHVCTPTHRSEQATWLNSGCSSHKLGDFVEMTPPLWASGSSVAHEGSTGT